MISTFNRAVRHNGSVSSRRAGSRGNARAPGAAKTLTAQLTLLRGLEEAPPPVRRASVAALTVFFLLPVGGSGSDLSTPHRPASRRTRSPGRFGLASQA